MMVGDGNNNNGAKSEKGMEDRTWDMMARGGIEDRGVRYSIGGQR